MLLPDIVKEIRSKVPDAQLHICCDNSPNLLRIFRLGYLDIVFVYCDANDVADAACSWTEDIGWVRAPDFAIHPTIRCRWSALQTSCGWIRSRLKH